ncbi:hypothetical protein ND486_11560 [Pseudonocardia sp. DR1-2]|uniref:hypothetical protein n=1 Tax=Pseudonocardia sp. DR1-2 TaxID=2951168 RepID=UPI0020436DE8|nr:hypothetical protein [Pseudonocardia sp. DR1-2]MCM3846826.1 hypothetical protein [Pseudonocardia sp. DR1-2]
MGMKSRRIEIAEVWIPPVLMAGLFGILWWAVTQESPNWIRIIFGIVCLGMVVWLQTTSSRDLRANRSRYSWAIIEPRTMTEFRDRQKSDHRPRQANIVATVSAVAALVTIGVTLFLAYFPPK